LLPYKFFECVKTSVGKREGRRPLGRPWRGWKDNKEILKETAFDVANWIHVAQYRDQ
jgi:hypothetical protein